LNLCRQDNIKLKNFRISLCLNNVADILLKKNYDGDSVQHWFYQLAMEISGFVQILMGHFVFQLLANLCFSYCVGLNGVNEFNYSWIGKAKNWLYCTVYISLR
jgi:hypothetical protein